MSWLSTCRLIGCAACLVLTNSALAAQDQRVHEHQQAMQAYAQQAGKAVPVVKEYVYGERLDIVKMVGMTDAIRSCEPIPMAMTYEDHAGQLTTVLYSSMGTCPKS